MILCLFHKTTEFKVVMEKAKPRQRVAEKNITWVNKKRAQVGRQAAENRIRVEGSLRVDRVSTMLEAFHLFFTDNIIDDIVRYTNKKFDSFMAGLRQVVLDRLNREKSHYNHVRGVTKEDVLAFIGLYYCRGAWQLNYFSYNRIWRKGVAVPIFPITMSRHRYVSSFYVNDIFTEIRY